MPNVWESKKRKAHHILLGNCDSNTSKFILTLSELGQVIWNRITFLHLDFMKFILQCQLPLITTILIQVHQCFQHRMQIFLAMEIRDSVVSNSLKDYLPCLRHTLLPFGQVLCILSCWLGDFLINEFLQAIIL